MSSFKENIDTLVKGVKSVGQAGASIGDAVGSIVDAGKKAVQFIKKPTLGNVWEAVKATTVNPVVKGVRRILSLVRIWNDKSWYVKYGAITPAANYGRPMDPLFNTLIQDKATNGAINRYVDVHLSWGDYTSSSAFDTSMQQSYQLLRTQLKSNLPYTKNYLKAYVINSIALAIFAKSLERDIAWFNFTSPEFRDFQKMWTHRVYGSQSYGVTQLSDRGSLSAENWATTISLYNKAVLGTVTNVRIPESLAMFISHYFGSVFTDSADGTNPAAIINVMENVPYAQYDKVTDSIVISQLNVASLTVDQYINAVQELGTEFGMVIADLTNSNQLVPLLMADINNYAYGIAFDPSFCQALINGYTSNSAVTAKGFVRMDKIEGVDDDLTQFLFLGSIDPSSSSTALRMEYMVLKYNSSADLTWSTQLLQETPRNNFVSDKPIGIIVTTDIQSDTYVNVSTGTIPILQYPVNSNGSPSPNVNDQVSDINIRYNIDETNITLPQYINIANNATAYIFIPVGMLSLTNPTRVLFGIGITATKTNGVFTVTDTIQSEIVGTDDLINYTPKWESTKPWSTPGGTYTHTINYTISHQQFGNYLRVNIVMPSQSGVLITSVLSRIGQEIQGAFQPYYLAAVMSITDVFAHLITPIANNSFNIIQGYTGLSAFIADQFDLHLPIVNKNRISVNLAEDGQVTLSSETTQDPILIKESYTPYYYNVYDLEPVLYKMFMSLFQTTTNILEKILKSYKGDSDNKKSRNKKGKGRK